MIQIQVPPRGVDHANRRGLYRSCQDSRQPLPNRVTSELPTVRELGVVALRNNHVSFVSERHNGVDAHGSPRGRVSGKQGDGQKQEGDSDEGDAIDSMESNAGQTRSAIA